MFWLFGTAGRSVAYAFCLAGVIAYDSWSALRYPDGGASFIFVIVWPIEVVTAALWAAADRWRQLSWAALMVRWTVVGLVAAWAETYASVDTDDGRNLYSWADLPGSIVEQLIVVTAAAAVGAGIFAVLAWTASQDRSQRAQDRPVTHQK